MLRNWIIMPLIKINVFHYRHKSSALLQFGNSPLNSFSKRDNPLSIFFMTLFWSYELIKIAFEIYLIITKRYLLSFSNIVNCFLKKHNLEIALCEYVYEALSFKIDFVGKTTWFINDLDNIFKYPNRQR